VSIIHGERHTLPSVGEAYLLNPSFAEPRHIRLEQLAKARRGGWAFSLDALLYPTQMLVADQTTFQQASRLWVVTEPGRAEPEGAAYLPAQLWAMQCGIAIPRFSRASPIRSGNERRSKPRQVIKRFIETI
jgi:hypothetical protein